MRVLTSLDEYLHVRGVGWLFESGYRVLEARMLAGDVFVGVVVEGVCGEVAGGKAKA